MKTKFLRTAAKAIACAAVAFSCAADASAAVAEKAAKENYLRFTSGTKSLAKHAYVWEAGDHHDYLEIDVEASSKKLTFTAKGLPKGLSINKKDGRITGTPTKPGAYTSTVTVKDDGGRKVSQKVKFEIRMHSAWTGSFYGRVYTSSTSDPCALTVKVDKLGKITGKVKENGKSYSFSSKFSSCEEYKAKFSLTLKIGSRTFKTGTVTLKSEEGADATPVHKCANKDQSFMAAKKSGVVKKGKYLASMIGWSQTFSVGSGTVKVKLLDGDSVKVTGTVGGKNISAKFPLLVQDAKLIISGPESNPDYTTRYRLYSYFIDPALKGWKLLSLTIDDRGYGDVKVVKAELKVKSEMK